MSVAMSRKLKKMFQTQATSLSWSFSALSPPKVIPRTNTWQKTNMTNEMTQTKTNLDISGTHDFKLTSIFFDLNHELTPMQCPWDGKYVEIWPTQHLYVTYILYVRNRPVTRKKSLYIVPPLYLSHFCNPILLFWHRLVLRHEFYFVKGKI